MASNYPTNPTTSSHDDFHVVVTIGTAFHDLVASLGNNNSYALVLVIDVQRELDSLEIPAALENRVLRLPLGNNRTLQELIEVHGTKSQKLALRELPPISSNDGLGQLACSGVAAVKELLSSTNVQRWLDDIVPEVIRRSGGQIPQLRLGIYAGTAGGVACCGASEFLNALISIIINSGIASIDASVFVVGGISFAGRGFQRTQQNAAISLAHWLNQFRKTLGASVTYSFYGLELTPVGNNRILRSQLLAGHLSALTASAVRACIHQERSNRSADGPVGNATLVTAGQFKAISHEQIRNDVASTYLEEIMLLRNVQPARESIKAIRFEYIDARRTVQPNDVLIQQMLQVDEPSAILELADPGPSFENVDIVVEHLDGTLQSLSKLDELFANLPASPEEFQERLSFLFAAEESCTIQLPSAREEAADLQLALDDAAKDLLKAHKRFVRRPLLSFQDEERRAERLQDAIEYYRECVSVWLDVTEEIQLLENALNVCSEFIVQHLKRLDNLISQLKGQVQHTREIVREPLVTAQNLSETFPELLAACLDPREHSLPQYIENCVEHVTRAGLRQVVGSEDDSHDAILSAVRSGHKAEQGPEWGGQDTQHATTFIVYPHVSKIDMNLLLAVHSQADPNTEIAFARREAPCRNVVVLRMAYCRQLKDLIAPYYKAGLQRVLADPSKSPLYLSDTSVLEDVGIRIK